MLRQADRESGGARGAFQAELKRQGVAARSETEVAEAVPPADVAELLGTEGAVLVRRHLMFADAVAVQMSASWIPLDIAARTQLAGQDTGPGGIYSRLADLGYEIAEYSETLTWRLADDEETAALQPGLWRVLSIRRLARTAVGRVVEVTDMVLDPSGWHLTYDWPADWSPLH